MVTSQQELNYITFAISIIGTLIACIIHRTFTGVNPLIRTETMPAYTDKNTKALAGAPP